MDGLGRLLNERKNNNVVKISKCSNTQNEQLGEEWNYHKTRVICTEFGAFRRDMTGAGLDTFICYQTISDSHVMYLQHQNFASGYRRRGQATIWRWTSAKGSLPQALKLGPKTTHVRHN